MNIDNFDLKYICKDYILDFIDPMNFYTSASFKMEVSLDNLNVEIILLENAQEHVYIIEIQDHYEGDVLIFYYNHSCEDFKNFCDTFYKVAHDRGDHFTADDEILLLEDFLKSCEHRNSDLFARKYGLK